MERTQNALNVKALNPTLLAVSVALKSVSDLASL